MLQVSLYYPSYDGGKYYSSSTGGMAPYSLNGNLQTSIAYTAYAADVNERMYPKCPGNGDVGSNHLQPPTTNSNPQPPTTSPDPQLPARIPKLC